MKNKMIKTLVLSSLIVSGVAQGAITISEKNFTSASVGVPIVSTLGVAAPLNSIYASSGIFVTTPDWATASAATIISMFTATDSTPLSNTTFTGLFTGNDTTTLVSYATGFQGANPYILVGNSSTLANSTLVAVYRQTTPVYATPVSGIANTAISGTTLANWVYGTQTAVTTQSTLTSASFSQGIALTSIPETSTALLGAIGALGLLRRRRN